MTLPKIKIQSSLRRKGFEEDVSRRHIVYEYQTLNGNESGISTYISHGSKSKDVSKKLCAQMAKQCKLTTKDFGRLINCDMNQDEYENKIKKHLNK